MTIDKPVCDNDLQFVKNETNKKFPLIIKVETLLFIEKTSVLGKIAPLGSVSDASNA